MSTLLNVFHAHAPVIVYLLIISVRSLRIYVLWQTGLSLQNTACDHHIGTYTATVAVLVYKYIRCTCTQGRLQKVWLEGANGGDWGRGALGAEVNCRRRESSRADSSAVIARIEAPRGDVWPGGGVPLPTGNGSREGAVPFPRIFLFFSSKGEFWCILGLIKPVFWSAWRLHFLPRLWWEAGAIAPSPLPWIRPCLYLCLRYFLHGT